MFCVEFKVGGGVKVCCVVKCMNKFNLSVVVVAFVFVNVGDVL